MFYFGFSHNPVNVCFGCQQFLHALSGRAILSIGCPLLGHQRGVLCVEGPNRRELFQPQIVKVFFRCFMEKDFALMLGKKLLGKRKTSYRLTNPIESARMKESLAESMGFS